MNSQPEFQDFPTIMHRCFKLYISNATLISPGKFQQERYQRKTSLRLFLKREMALLTIDCENKNNKGLNSLVGRPERSAMIEKLISSIRKFVLILCMYFYLLFRKGVNSCSNNEDDDHHNNNTMSQELFKHFTCVNSNPY